MAKYIIMPKLGFNMDQGTVVQWLNKEGDAIKEREEVLEIETDKTVIPVEVPCSGVLRKILVAEGEVVPVTLPIAIIGEKDEDISDMVEAAYQKLGKKEVTEAPKEVTPVIEKKPILEPRKEAEKRISPRARRKAKELGIQIERLIGSGPASAINEKDVLTYHKTQQEKINTEEQVDKRIPYTGMRKIIGDRLSQSKFTAPHIFFTVSIDMSEVIDLLNRFNQDSEERISINDYLVSTVAKVLTEQPNINCSLVGEEIVYHKDINIGVAVALKEGLIVPVIKNTNKKSLSILSKEIKKLIKLAREKKLIPDNYKEGTFTVSNLGMYGIDNFTAIINPPEAAILAVGTVRRAPIVIEEEGAEKLGICSLMKVTLSVDHRLIDGATAATFLKQVKDYLEFPEGLVL
jgi:pyruvate dehydrogenase E2 component (dihydrolipoamide acetyltransferase)